MAIKQLEIAGTEVERDHVLEGLLEEHRRSRGDLKRAQARHTVTGAAVIRYQLEGQIARYEYTVDGERYRSELSCPEPTVKLTFVGNEE